MGRASSQHRSRKPGAGEPGPETDPTAGPGFGEGAREARGGRWGGSPPKGEADPAAGPGPGTGNLNQSRISQKQY
jgi:hypothetical protein